LYATAQSHPDVSDHARAYSPLARALRDATLDRDAAELSAALRLTEGQVFAHRMALVWFLADADRVAKGRDLALQETYRIGRIADAIWALRPSAGMAVYDVGQDDAECAA
jgi:hypothetical protein